MSIFGQVWLFSAAAFVLGALLAWLFLVLPARSRIRDLERRLETARESAAAAQRRESAGNARPAEEDGEPFAPVPSTRQFVPAAEQDDEFAQAEPTERLAPAPGWHEQNSLEGYEHRPAHDADSSAASDVTSVLDAADREYEDQGYDGQGYEDQGEGLDHEETGYDEPRHDEPRHEEPRYGEYETYGEEPAPAPQPEPERRPASLFEPAQYEPAPDEHPRYEQEPMEPETTEQPPAYAFGGGPGADGEPDEPAVEQTQLLPKRQPRQSPRGGFDPPQPIRPSMRAVTRREPEDADVHSGSLFEPANGSEPAEAPPARDHGAYGSDLPPGPFGPGSAMPQPGGGRPSEEYTVKASVTALRYCTEESAQFPNMVAEVWFRTPADAERVGFRPLA
ncbi:sunset domain-containing protein [Qaidamihabitans albus]|uniref:sunset domain-containing protein n=1 Tax=Qaidamihabitans albus TaxID=2795733 RepID=UPI0018F20ECE|nr:LapA family protein [Qaidamihabitans albus]